MNRALRPALLAAAAGLAAAALLVPSEPLRAADPPHWLGVATTYDCTNSCHQLHTSLGGSLTSLAGNANLCQSCHKPGQSASDLSVNDADRASLATDSGLHHAWNVSKTNSAAGADGTISSAAMMQRLNLSAATCPTQDCITCSTCHNQHDATSASGGLPRVGKAKLRTALGSTGTLATGGAFTGANGLWYLVESQTNSTFRWSKDGGVSWFAQNVAMTKGTAQLLDNGVTVMFSTTGAFVANERWEFDASWPFLRIPIDSGDNATGAKFCRDCHSAWTMDHTGTGTWTGTARSHPVGIALNANGGNYDRTAPLDADGVSQATGDGNPFNDLKLDATGRVQCWSCHGAHYAPSNGAAVMP